MERPTLAALDPAGFRAVVALEKHLRSRMDARLMELVWLRASMTNGCAFCIDLHSSTALEEGESVGRLLALAAWRESPSFSDQERAALALTDAVTAIEGGVGEDVWSAAVAHFDESGTMDLLLAIALIHVWNRLAISTRMQAPDRGRAS